MFVPVSDSRVPSKRSPAKPAVNKIWSTSQSGRRKAPHKNNWKGTSDGRFNTGWHKSHPPFVQSLGLRGSFSEFSLFSCFRRRKVSNRGVTILSIYIFSSFLQLDRKCAGKTLCTYPHCNSAYCTNTFAIVSWDSCCLPKYGSHRSAGHRGSLTMFSFSPYRFFFPRTLHRANR